MMPDLPITAEARGAVRVFKANLRRADVRFQAKFESLEASREAARWANCGSLGRARALRNLRRLFGPQDCHVQDRPVWAHLRPRDAVILTPNDPGQAQDAVVVEYVTITGDGDLETGLWTLEVPDHALLRCAQRFREINLRDAILDAHRNLLAIRCDPLPTGDVLIGAGPGAFVGQMIYGQEVKGGVVVYFRPRTWLHEDQIQDHRVWLTDAGPGAPWADGPLTPFPLREITVEGSSLSVRKKVA